LLDELGTESVGDGRVNAGDERQVGIILQQGEAVPELSLSAVAKQGLG
jgi:hypothetical protein